MATAAVAAAADPDDCRQVYAADRSTELAMNDDTPNPVDGSQHLASYLEWTAPSSGQFFVAVRGFK